MYFKQIKQLMIEHGVEIEGVRSIVQLRSCEVAQEFPEVGVLVGKDGYAYVDLYKANLSGADLRGAHLSGADLYKANLSGADLRGAHLRWADLRGADLSGAHLRRADLCDADLSGAHLSGAHLSGAGSVAKIYVDGMSSEGEAVIANIRTNAAGDEYIHCYRGCFDGDINTFRQRLMEDKPEGPHQRSAYLAVLDFLAVALIVEAKQGEGEE
jgi:hypothetical protein